MFYKLSILAILLIVNIISLNSHNHYSLDNNSSDYSINSPIIRDSVHWESLPPLPEAKVGPCVGYSYDYQNKTTKLYVLGGDPPEQNDIMYIFDFDSLTWSDPIQMPCSISHAGCVSYDWWKNIYLIGGYPAKDEIWIYNTDTDSFSQGPDLLIGVEDPIVEFVFCRIAVIGGFDGQNVINNVQLYDLQGDSLNEGTPLPSPRMAGAAFYMECEGAHFFIVCLGQDSLGNYPTNTYLGEYLYPYTDSINWQPGPDFPGEGCEYPGFGNSNIFPFDSRYSYVFGGFNSNYLNQCYRISRAYYLWEPSTDIPDPARSKIGSCGFPLYHNQRVELCLAAIGGYNDSALTCFHILHTDFELVGVEETPPVISNQISCNLLSSNIISDHFKLEFNLPNSSAVSFSVFNITGRKIYQHGNLNLTPGIHYIDWNLNDNLGEKLSTGIYFFILETDSGAFRGKFTVIR